MLAIRTRTGEEIGKTAMEMSGKKSLKIEEFLRIDVLQH
jgi:hypothetical protein